jgi:peptidoglycan/LPS O-acetylase OafA/YrhL
MVYVRGQVQPPMGRFKFVDALRGIAALSVVLFHAEEAKHIDALLDLLPRIIRSILQQGQFGVAIFFVVSGFVIAHSVFDRDVTWPFAGRFMLRRSIRLDPPYWLAVALAMVFSTMAAHSIASDDMPSYSAPQIAAHIFYLQDVLGYPVIGAVFWTLCLELQFYLVFAAILAATKSSDTLRSWVFMIAFALSTLWPLGILSGPDASFLPLWHAFLLGAGTYWSWRGRFRLIFFLFLGAVTLGSVFHANGFTIVAVVTALTILVVAYAGRLETLLENKILQFAGAISYSLYLLHNPVSRAAFQIFNMSFEQSPISEASGLIFALLVCFMTAWLFRQAIEKPSIRLSRYVSLTPPLKRQAREISETRARVSGRKAFADKVLDVTD